MERQTRPSTTRSVPLWSTGVLVLRVLVLGWIAARRVAGPALVAAVARRRPGHLRRATAPAVRIALEEAGPTFVKLGQLLAARPDVVGSTLATELRRLTDRAAPMRWSEVAEVLSRRAPGDWRRTFAWVDPAPLASASVAQVHAARLHDGTDVVVKVQRPAAARHVARDSRLLLGLARSLERFWPRARALGVGGLVAGFVEALRTELDFEAECATLLRFRSRLPAAEPRAVLVPRPYAGLSSSRVLVMERLPGVSPGAAELAGRPEERRRAASLLLREVLRQVLVTGLFHADPHRGNVLVLPDGRVGLVDLGCVAELGTPRRLAVWSLLRAVGRHDAEAAASALGRLVEGAQVDRRRLVGELHRLLEVTAGARRTPRDHPLDGLLTLTVRLGLTVAPEVAALFRCLSTLTGVLAELDADLDLVAALEAHASALWREEVVGGTGGQLLWQELVETAASIRRRVLA